MLVWGIRTVNTKLSFVFTVQGVECLKKCVPAIVKNCSSLLQVMWLMMTPCLSLFLFFMFMTSFMVAAQPAGCKIRITDRGLEMCRYTDTWVRAREYIIKRLKVKSTLILLKLQMQIPPAYMYFTSSFLLQSALSHSQSFHLHISEK